jgi:hypothetical protein
MVIPFFGVPENYTIKKRDCNTRGGDAARRRNHRPRRPAYNKQIFNGLRRDIILAVPDFI